MVIEGNPAVNTPPNEPSQILPVSPIRRHPIPNCGRGASDRLFPMESNPVPSQRPAGPLDQCSKLEIREREQDDQQLRE